MIIYILIGLAYWALNSFVRKLETGGDWLLPLVWFLAWPIAFLSWAALFFEKLLLIIGDWLETKNRTKHF